jgi:TrmH family RNA methyltransferase
MAQPPIDSPHNSHIAAAHALLSRKARQAASAFLVEGPHAVGEALRSPDHRVREIFVTDPAADRDPDLLTRAAAGGAAVRTVTDRALAALRDTVSPQGLIAVVEPSPTELSHVVKPETRLVVVLDGIADPGNAGTVIRSADAAGAAAVITTPGSVDTWSGKCVRASAGSIFHLPVVGDVPPEAVFAAVATIPAIVLATAADGADDLDDLVDSGALAAPTVWVFGNEAHGVSAAARRRADRIVRVPVYGAAESLNLAAAAAICLYASARAHRPPPI